MKHIIIIYLSVSFLLIGCTYKEMIFSAKRVKLSQNPRNISDKHVNFEKCHNTTTEAVKNLNKFEDKVFQFDEFSDFIIKRKIKARFLYPTGGLNVRVVYRECYEFLGIPNETSYKQKQ